MKIIPRYNWSRKTTNRSRSPYWGHLGRSQIPRLSNIKYDTPFFVVTRVNCASRKPTRYGTLYSKDLTGGFNGRPHLGVWRAACYRPTLRSSSYAREWYPFMKGNGIHHDIRNPQSAKTGLLLGAGAKDSRQQEGHPSPSPESLSQFRDQQGQLHHTEEGRPTEPPVEPRFNAGFVGPRFNSDFYSPK